VARTLGHDMSRERSKIKICDVIRRELVKVKTFRERKADAIAHLPGGWNPERCGGRGPGMYRKEFLVNAAEHLGVSDREIKAAGVSHKKLCALLQKYGIDKNNQPENIHISPPPAQRAQQVQQVQRAQQADVNNAGNRLRRSLKVRFEREHKKRACQDKSSTNPKPYTTHEFAMILQRLYGFTNLQIRSHLANRFGPAIFGKTFGELNELRYRTEMCTMLQKYFDTGFREVQRDAMSPRSQRRVNDFEATLPRDHPVMRTSSDMKRTWLKLQLQMRLSPEEIRTQRTRNFDNLAQRAMQFNLDRMMQEQMNNPNIRTVGLNNPGNNWTPSVGNNVNNVLNTAQNNIFLAGNIPHANKAVYLKPNVQNRKIQAVYNQNSLKKWLMKKKTSPYTSKEIQSWNNVKRVPEKIMRRHGDNVYFGIKDAEVLESIHPTKYVSRLLKVFKQGKTFESFKRDVRNGVHVRDEQEYQDLRTSCATYVTMLKDYVTSKKTKKEQKETLKRLDNRNPACLENACSAINEFIQEDSNEFVFDFDPELDLLTNISNCANALRKSYCVMYKKKEINKESFIKKMKGLHQAIFNNVRGKVAKDGAANPSDIRKFLEDYGEMLLDCPGMKIPKTLFKGFKFNFALGGAL
jgi:hypothetical protein